MSDFSDYTKQLGNKDLRELAKDVQAVTLLDLFVQIFPGATVTHYENLRPTKEESKADQCALF